MSCEDRSRLLSHAHFDHLDLRHWSARSHRARHERFIEGHPVFLFWVPSNGARGRRFRTWRLIFEVTAFPVNHWAHSRDMYRGDNRYLIESRNRGRRRIVFAGDTAMTENFVALRRHGQLRRRNHVSISAYNPWIQSHCTPEQAVQMANAAGAHFSGPGASSNVPPQL